MHLCVIQVRPRYSGFPSQVEGGVCTFSLFVCLWLWLCLQVLPQHNTGLIGNVGMDASVEGCFPHSQCVSETNGQQVGTLTC